MRLLLVIIGFHLVLQPILASNNDQVIIELDDQVDGSFIGTSIFYVKDAEYRLNFEQISDSSFQHNFIRSDMVRPNFGNQQLAIWNKFTVTKSTDKNWTFQIGFYAIDTIVVYYQRKNGSYDSIVSGRSVPYQEKQYLSTKYAFDIPVEQGDTTTIYFKISTYIMQYPISVHTQESFIGAIHKEDILNGAYVGFVILIILYNFMIWTSIRDSNHLYYIAYVFFTAMLAMELNGIASQFIWIGPLTDYWSHGPFIVSLSSIFAIIFTTKFLETSKNSRILDKVFRYGLIPAFLIIIVLDILGLNLYASVLNQSFGFLNLILMFIAGLISYRKGFLAARFYLSATSFYFLGAAIFVLKTFAVIPINFVTNNAIEIGSAMEMVLFSLALADKISIYKNEKEAALRENAKLIREQNIVLEKTVEERTEDLRIEKEKSENLLLNILPKEIADELKEKGEAEAKNFNSITILFSDVEDFTGIAEKYSARELVSEINECFKAFDSIMDKYELEKIKTIGDAYMAVAGIRSSSNGLGKKAVYAALEMQKFLIGRASLRSREGKIYFNMRIGLHTGPVVAGIVGHKKFQYDVWGDAVNTAARIEASGESGKVNISEATLTLVKDDPRLKFIPRGKVEVKGKGEINMYFVEEQSA